MKMNKLFLTLLFSALLMSGYTQGIISEDFLDNIETNAKSLWSENNAEFSSNITPAKYNKESAVIIGYKRSVTIDKKSRAGFFTRKERSLLFFENYRFKIKFNDKNSVKNFTEIYFRFYDKEDGFSAKVIKPDGTVHDVSLNDAVRIDASGNVPEFFKSFFDQESGNQLRYYKVAIHDLEPGDILEYVSITKNKLDVANSGYIEFSPQYEICSKNYPILYNQIAIETDEKSYFKSMAFNGAPEFKKEASSEDGFFKYVFTDHDRAVEKDVNFIKPFQVYPVTKFQVIYSNSEKVKGALIGEVGQIKTGFTKTELAKKAWEDYVQVGDYGMTAYGTVQNYVDATTAQLKKLGSKEWSDQEYINNVYYKIRNTVVNRDNYLSDKMFAYIFGSLLYQKDIKSDLIITISNSIGGLKDVLFDNEIRYVIKINNSYYFNCVEHSNPGELVETLLGNESYIIKEPVKKTGDQEITPLTLPNSVSADNVAKYDITATLATDMNTIDVTRTSTYTGLSKTNHIDEALKYTTYMLDDWKNYGGESPTERMRAKEEDDYYESVREIKTRYAESKLEYSKKEVEREFTQKIKFGKFVVASEGRTLKKKDLIFTEDFKMMDMLRKAGKKYLVNVSGLVGGQLQIKKEERIRKYDMNVGYAKTYIWNISFKIPAGYTVDGLKELNTSVDNEVGNYSSVAELNGDNVVLKIQKTYKKANVSKDKWNDMLAFVDAAYNNSFKYILLIPKQ